VIKYFGIRIGLLVLPIIALGAYAILAFVPILSVVRWAKTAENATDYSLQNTVRQALFLPTTREEKYKAKQAIDTFFVRAGDVFSAGLVYVGVNWLMFSTSHFAMFNFGLVIVWFIIAVLIGKRYTQMTAG
jgi:AAA family ATP:ADP antiporter